MEIAAAQAPDVRVARTRVLEARGRLAGARVFATENPTIEGVTGESDEISESTELDLTVPLGFGLRRLYRVREARADLEREKHLETDSRRLAVGAALGAYYRVLHAEQRLSIARDRSRLADELVQVATDRMQAGDAARLDVIVAEVEASRGKSEVLAEERNVAVARALLATALGFSSGEELEVAGDLGDRSLFDRHVDSASPDERADILALKSDVEATSAAVSLARAELIPELAFRMNYEKSGGEEIVRPGAALSIPLFNWGQGARGEAQARRERARAELEIGRASARAEAEGARAAYQRMAASAREIEDVALPRAREIEELVSESYAAGKIDLPQLLVVRSNALETRREHADRLLEAAFTGIDLAVAVGSLPEQSADDRSSEPEGKE
jgi:cobalt-zinc-cadmium efflux system outer membrane protein